MVASESSPKPKRQTIAGSRGLANSDQQRGIFQNKNPNLAKAVIPNSNAQELRYTDSISDSSRRSVRLGCLPKVQKSYNEPVTFHYEIQNHTTRMHKLTKTFQVYRLTFMTLVCIFAGLIIGLLCRKAANNWTERQFMYIEFPGELYLRFLRLLIIPLLVSNVILSFGSIQTKLSSHLAKIAGLFYVMSNLLAIIVAISIAMLLCRCHQPHEPSSIEPSITPPFQNHSPQHQVASKFIKKPISSRDSLGPDGPGYQDQQVSSTDGGNARLPHLVGSPALQTSDRPHPARQPGDTHNDEDSSETLALSNNANYFNKVPSSVPIDIMLDLMRNLVPDNAFAATIRQTHTNSNPANEESSTRMPVRETVEQANILGLLAASILTGVVLSRMDEAGRPLLELCSCVSELSLRLSLLVVNMTPVCIMFLLIGQVARTNDLGAKLGAILVYVTTVITALAIFAFMVLPLVYWLLTKRSPFALASSLSEVLVAAFATSSSSATLALLLSRLIQSNLNPWIVRAFGPLGSVFNMNGTVIYEVVACLFIAQANGQPLTIGSILLTGLISAVAGLSTVGIPSSGIMTLVMVVNTVNLAEESVPLIFIVDFLIDRFRTVVNVWSGALVCALINHFCPERLIDEQLGHRKFLELIKFRPGSLKGSCRSTKASSNPNGLDGSADQHTSVPNRVISVTITPPPQEPQGITRAASDSSAHHHG